jgi:ABC-type phosphate transport system substrate-binding protein
VIAVLLLAASLMGAARAQEVIVIAHPGIPAVDRAQLARLYTGRSVEVAGQVVTVANAQPDSTLRDQFLHAVIGMDEARYRAYWTVRRHIGKGVPPPDVAPDAAMIEFVTHTPGAIGYISSNSVTGGLNVVARF